MTPSLILHLWRERWGKAEQSNPNKPYLLDAVYQWGVKIPASNAFAIPGTTLFVVVLFAAFAFFVANLRFSLNGQISFAGLMVCAALLLRRYSGPFFTLCLISLTLLCLAQYFTWRFGQTLQNQFGWSFVWAFGLAALELVVAFYFALGWLISLSPIRETAIAMPDNQKDWPSINLVLLSDAMREDKIGIEQINQLKIRLDQLVWPDKKLFVSQFTISSGDSNHRFNQIDELIKQTQQDLVLFIETNALNQTKLWQWIDSKNFLERISAWFIRDAGLAFLYGKNGFLSTQFNQTQALINSRLNAHSLPISMVRKAAWQRLGMTSAHKKTNALIRKSSLLIAELANKKTPDLQIEQKNEFVFFKVDRANSKFVQGLKAGIINTRKMLRHYKNILALAFLSTPFALLVFGTQVVSAKFEWFLALSVPAIILFSITNSRTNIYSRWSSWRQFKESLLALFFLCLTPIKFVTTVMKRPSLLLHRWWSQISAFELAIEVLVVILFFGNLVGLVHSLNFFLTHDSNGHQWRIFYVTWAALNCLLLLSRQAIEHEKAHIIWFGKRQAQQSGTVHLPMGRTVVCKSLNFPNDNLVLQLPIDIQAQYGVTIGQSIMLSFWHFHQHFSWKALVKTIDSRNIEVSIAPSEQGFIQFTQALFARDKTWPAWLPSKNADRPFPAWFYSFIESLPAKMIDLSARFMGLFTLDSISRLWKQKK
jgi:cellulose synthase (UDP-forming)